MATCPTSSAVIARQSQESKRGPWSSQETSWGLVPLQHGSRRARIPGAELKRASGPMGGWMEAPAEAGQGHQGLWASYPCHCLSQSRTKISSCLVGITSQSPSHIQLSGFAVKIWSEFVAVVIPLKCHMFSALSRSCTALLPYFSLFLSTP